MLDTLPTEGVIALVVALAGAAYWYLKRGNTAKAGDLIAEAESELRGILADQTPLPIPETEELSRGEIKEALRDAGIDAEESPDAAVSLWLSDGTYYAPVPEDFAEATDALALTSIMPYRPETFDCEDFSRFFQVLTTLVNGVNAVGTVYDWSGAHAYSVLVTADGEAHIIEPQNGDGGQFEEKSGAYEMENANIVF